MHARHLDAHLLHQPDDELDVRERELDVELGDLLHPVGAKVLVSKQIAIW